MLAATATSANRNTSPIHPTPLCVTGTRVPCADAFMWSKSVRNTPMMKVHPHAKMNASVMFLVTEAKAKIGSIRRKRRKMTYDVAETKDDRHENPFASPRKR